MKKKCTALGAKAQTTLWNDSRLDVWPICDSFCMSLTKSFPLTTASNSTYALEPIQNKQTIIINVNRTCTYRYRYVIVVLTDMQHKLYSERYLALSSPYQLEVHVNISDKGRHVPREHLRRGWEWKAISGISDPHYRCWMQHTSINGCWWSETIHQLHCISAFLILPVASCTHLRNIKKN